MSRRATFLLGVGVGFALGAFALWGVELLILSRMSM